MMLKNSVESDNSCQLTMLQKKYISSLIPLWSIHMVGFSCFPSWSIMVEDVIQLHTNLSMLSFTVWNHIFPEMYLLSLSHDSEVTFSLVSYLSIFKPYSCTVAVLGDICLMTDANLQHYVSVCVMSIIHRRILFPVTIFLFFRNFVQVLCSNYFFRYCQQENPFDFNGKIIISDLVAYQNSIPRKNGKYTFKKHY